MGDKRTQLVYDLDTWDDVAVIDELMEAETFLCFGPDSLARGPQSGLPAGPPRTTAPGNAGPVDRAATPTGSGPTGLAGRP